MLRAFGYLLQASLLLASTYALTYRGADISSVPLVEAAGVSYTDGGSVTKFETIIKNHGANTARIRLWTAGTYDLAYGLAYAKRVKAAGLTLIVDLHYSDTWADPGHQAIPSSWPTTLSGLNTEIYNYTLGVAQSFAENGTPIDIMQIGNEINDGLLWPVGQISVQGFSPASQLLHSAANGARAGGVDTVTVHLANGWDWSDLSYWFDGMFIQGAFAKTDINMVGVSFYPFYGTNATLSALQSSLTNLVNLLDLTIYVAETDWPVTCSGVALSEPSIPISAAGQTDWIVDITDVLNALPNERGQGILYWEPGWVGSAALGSSCADNLLVSSTGATRTSIGIFADM